MPKPKPTFATFILAAILPLFLSGCMSLRELDDSIGRGFEKASQLGFSVPSSPAGEGSLRIDNERSARIATATLENLTQAQKVEIDNWLDENGLNRYGDPQDTVYDGGTPLYDKASGQSIDRFEYILRKFPSLVDGAE